MQDYIILNILHRTFLGVGSWHLDTSACWRPTIWLIKMRMVGIRINMRKNSAILLFLLFISPLPSEYTWEYRVEVSSQSLKPGEGRFLHPVF